MPREVAHVLVAPPHEQLGVYRSSLKMVAMLESVVTALPPTRNDLRDQLRRAASSVVLNLAEGADEYSPAEKARFFRMSRRSAAECLAVLDILTTVHGVVIPAEVRGQILGVHAVVSRLIQNQERGRSAFHRGPR